MYWSVQWSNDQLIQRRRMACWPMRVCRAIRCHRFAIPQENNYRDSSSLSLSNMEASRLTLQRTTPVYFRAYINQSDTFPATVCGRFATTWAIYSPCTTQDMSPLQTWKRNAYYIRYRTSPLYVLRLKRCDMVTLVWHNFVQ